VTLRTWAGPGLALCLAAGASAQDVSVVAPQPRQLGERLERAWKAKDAGAYLDLWTFKDQAARDEESAFIADLFRAEDSSIEVFSPASVPGDKAQVHARAFTINEPRGRLEQWTFEARRGTSGWTFVGREALPGVEGLLHLSLDPQAYRADGLTIRLEDFELRLLHGSLFTSPANLGPTMLLFIGEGEVVVKPRPPSEREQLRQFCGTPEMKERVRAAFIRLHPADLHRVLQPVRLTPYPEGARDLKAARELYDEQAPRSFLLDTSFSRSPWWIYPGLGDAAVNFRTARRGTLTYAVSSSENEGISLFDRERRRQICLYPVSGRSTDYNEDADRSVDVLAHDLQVRFDPERSRLEGQNTMRLRLLAASSTLRLRLDDSLGVTSIATPLTGPLAFFRVRGQGSVMVSLGPLSGLIGDISLTVGFVGYHRPAAVEQELQIVPRGDADVFDREVVMDEVLTYSNRTAWYPQAGTDDYATARLRLDVPDGWSALTGGVRLASRREGGRHLQEYRQDLPAKYITVVVGRFQEVGHKIDEGRTLEAFGLIRTRSEAERTLEQASDILHFFESEFGPYPYATLRLAVVEGITPGGHSPPGLVILSRRPPLARGELRDDPATFWDMPGFFFAHELAHQWWGHGVSGQNYRERWISEGFAQYAAALWMRHSRGDEAFTNVLRRLGRWALRENAQGPIHLGHRLGHVAGDPQIYRAIVYNKSAYVLHMLRGIVGEEAFRKAAQRLQERHRFGKVGTLQVQQVLEEVAGRPLGPYFQGWVYGTLLPHLEVSRQVDRVDGNRVVVDVRARDLPGPVPLLLSVVHAGGRASRTVTLEPQGGQFEFETKGSVGRVEVNEDRGLLATVGPNR
jgi:Peptidase family M1 domain